MTSLKYPLNIQDVGLYLQFVAYDYNSAPTVGNSDIRSALVRPGGFSPTDPNLGLEVASSSTSGGESSPAQAMGSVFLYLPPKLDFSYGAEWKKVQFGALGSAFGGANIMESIGSAASIGAVTAGKVLTDRIAQALENVPKVEGVDLDSVLGGAFGVTFNDNTIQTFDKMQLRNFSYDYLLLSRSPSEETMIRNIIKFFKLAMHPSSQESGKNNTLFLQYPYIFRIVPSQYKNTIAQRIGGKVYRKGSGTTLSSFVPQTKYCALTKFDVSYTPDNVISVTPGGYATAVRLSMQFSELTNMTRGDIETFEDPSGFAFPAATQNRQNIKDPGLAQRPEIKDTRSPGDPGYTPPSPGGLTLPGV